MLKNCLLLFIFFLCTRAKIESAVIGYYEPADGLGQIHSCIYDVLNIIGKSSFISSRNNYLPPQNYNLGLKRQSYDLVFFADILENRQHKPLKYLPIKSTLNIAYSMFESDEIPPSWVTILNQNFDVVIVPDPFLRTVYENCGVQKPIFVIPAPIKNIFDSYNNLKKNDSKFTFLYSSMFSDRKNQITLLQAFKQKFANNPNFELVLHGRKSDDSIKNIYAEVKNNNLTNVKVIDKKLNREEYIQLIKSASCYISPSKGEGFAIPPRESLAAGIPVILTNCSAQATMCENSFFISVPAEINEDCFYEKFGKNIGKCKNCKVSDLADAMEKVAKDYNYYFNLAQKNRFWSYNFSIESFKKRLEYFLFYESFADYKSYIMSLDQAENFAIFFYKLNHVRLKYFSSQYDMAQDNEQLNNFLTLNG